MQSITDQLTYVMQKVNEVYSSQVHFYFKIQTLRISTLPAQYDYDSVVDDDDPRKCKSTISMQLNKLETYVEENENTNYKFWHLIDDCVSGIFGQEITIGLANMPSVSSECPDPGSDFNPLGIEYGVSYIFDTYRYENLKIPYTKSDRRTWVLVAHELGHNMAIPHPFDSGGSPGSFGGIMDYGNALVTQSISGNTIVSFKLSSARSKMCGSLKNLKNNCPSRLRKHSLEPTTLCGNKKLDSPLEECECSNGSTSCKGCQDCKWLTNYECSSETIFYEPCRCNDNTNSKILCDGVCDEDGDCFVLNDICNKASSSVQNSYPCYSKPGNPCKVICENTQTTPSTCDYEVIVDLFSPCFHHNQWGVCKRLDSNPFTKNV